MAFIMKSNNEEKKPMYNIIKHCGVVDTGEKGHIEVNYMAWNGGAPKYDIRRWGKDKEGNVVPMKGFSMSGEEIAALCELLNKIAAEEEA